MVIKTLIGAVFQSTTCLLDYLVTTLPFGHRGMILKRPKLVKGTGCAKYVILQSAKQIICGKAMAEQDYLSNI
jgi:hypothetical protein